MFCYLAVFDNIFIDKFFYWLVWRTVNLDGEGSIPALVGLNSIPSSRILELISAVIGFKSYYLDFVRHREQIV